jgi:hypothetical protein
MTVKAPTTRVVVVIPVDLDQRSPQNTALTRVAIMLEHGNRIVGDKWLVVTDYSTGTISLVPQP